MRTILAGLMLLCFSTGMAVTRAITELQMPPLRIVYVDPGMTHLPPPATKRGI